MSVIHWALPSTVWGGGGVWLPVLFAGVYTHSQGMAIGRGHSGMLRLMHSLHLGEYLQVFSPKQPVFPNKHVPPSYWGKDAWPWAFWKQRRLSWGGHY